MTWNQWALLYIADPTRVGLLLCPVHPLWHNILYPLTYIIKVFYVHSAQRLKLNLDYVIYIPWHIAVFLSWFITKPNIQPVENVCWRKSNVIYTLLTSGRFPVIILAVHLVLRIPRLVQAPPAGRIVGNSPSLDPPNTLLKYLSVLLSVTPSSHTVNYKHSNAYPGHIWKMPFSPPSCWFLPSL